MINIHHNVIFYKPPSCFFTDNHAGTGQTVHVVFRESRGSFRAIQVASRLETKERGQGYVQS